MARPLDNTDFGMIWRKKAAFAFMTFALREYRGDDMRAERFRFTCQLWTANGE